MLALSARIQINSNRDSRHYQQQRHSEHSGGVLWERRLGQRRRAAEYNKLRNRGDIEERRQSNAPRSLFPQLKELVRFGERYLSIALGRVLSDKFLVLYLVF